MSRLNYPTYAAPTLSTIRYSSSIVHDSYFDDRALTQMQIKTIQPFILKSVDSINNQSNNNGPNAKLKALYNILKEKWILKYVTSRFQPHHTNFVLVEIGEDFTVLSGNNISYSFAKTCLPPPP